MKIKILEIRKPGTKEERVFMKVMQKCNLSDFIVYDETFDDEGEPSNLMPHMHRLPAVQAKEGMFVSLRTQGDPAKSHLGTLDDDETPCYYEYWGLERTIFNQEGDTVHLVEIADETSKTYESED